MSAAGGHEPTLEQMAATLADIDVDGALQETASHAFPSTRVAFLRRSLGSLAAAGAGGLFIGEAAAAKVWVTSSDVAFLRFDLTLEYLQSSFYTEAERLAKLDPTTMAWVRVVSAHERAHVEAIKGLLGPSRTVPRPTFNFRGVTSDQESFVKTAVAFEDLTVALMKWQAPRLDSRAVVAAAVSLHSVEARHAAWIRYLVGLKPVTSPFDEPRAQRQMARLIARTKFIVPKPRMVRRGLPRFTG
jgi:Ferritin-like domain